jgi:hypothetical protein
MSVRLPEWLAMFAAVFVWRAALAGLERSFFMLRSTVCWKTSGITTASFGMISRLLLLALLGWKRYDLGMERLVNRSTCSKVFAKLFALLP